MSQYIEPGVLRGLQLVALSQILVLPVLRRWVGANLGIEVPLAIWLPLNLTGPLCLLFYTSIPWFRQTLGRGFVPLAIAFYTFYVIAEKYVTIHWLTPVPMRELNELLLMLRLWLSFHVIMLVVAWHYSLRSVLLACFVLTAVDGVLTLPALHVGSSLYSLAMLIFIIRTVTVTLIACAINILLQRQREQRHALAEANRKLTHLAATSERLAVSQERNRLARELHDTLAHSLSAVAVQLEATEALLDTDPNTARTMLRRALNNTRGGLTEARRALQALRASPLDDAGLVVALSNLARSTAARANLKLDLVMPAELDDLGVDKEQCVYRVAQEALANVARHAAASTVRVALAQDNGHLTLSIADNGRGFALDAIPGYRYGLRGMRERAEMLGGVLEVQSQPDQGTTVRLALALNT